MDKNYSTTISAERKRGQHLGAEERGVIQCLKRLGYSNRAIAREINCSPATVGYELQRGTPAYCGKGRKPKYSPKYGEKIYQMHRRRCCRPKTHYVDTPFITWMAEMVQSHKWSFDVCVGRAKRLNLFPKDAIPCTKTLYNLLWKGELPLTLFELPEVLSRGIHRKPRIPKRQSGRSIDDRPAEVEKRNTFGHWESDTVIGRKKKGEPAVFSMVERLTGYYLAIGIEGKTSVGVSDAMALLYNTFEEHFRDIFRTITTDNGSEFADFSEVETYGSQIYFAHPYSSWERAVNERSNRLLRRFIPKGKSMKAYTPEQILMFADEINAIPRRRLGYCTPEELFEEQLDMIYQIST